MAGVEDKAMVLSRLVNGDAGGNESRESSGSGPRILRLVGGGTAEQPCVGQKFSAQEFLSNSPSAKLHDSARL